MSQTKFDAKKINFASTKFLGDVNFEFTDFVVEPNQTTVHFESTYFANKANFTRATFDEAIFYMTLLPDTLHFEDINVKRQIDLTHAKLKPNQKYCYINLIDAPIEKINMSYDKFKILIPEGWDIVNNDNIETLANAKSTFEKLTKVYESLLNKFKNEGLITSYERLDKEYQQFRLTQNPELGTIGKIRGSIFSYINWAWNDYGYA